MENVWMRVHMIVFILEENKGTKNPERSSIEVPGYFYVILITFLYCPLQIPCSVRVPRCKVRGLRKVHSDNR